MRLRMAGRSPAPSGVQLPGFARFAAMLGEDGGHAPAVREALPRHRNQELHRRLRRNPALAYLLLNRLRQKLHERQSPRHPARAAIETPRQFLQAVAETLL